MSALSLPQAGPALSSSQSAGVRVRVHELLWEPRDVAAESFTEECISGGRNRLAARQMDGMGRAGGTSWRLGRWTGMGKGLRV